MNVSSKTLRLVLVCSVFLFLCQPAVGQVPVHHTEGLVHGFLVLRTLEGETLAHGDLIQVAHADRVTARLIFHFKDGSLHDETAVYSQLRSFRLLRDHLVQKGPSFSHPEDVSIEVLSGQVTVRYTGDDGKEQVKTEHMKLPPDLANGMIFTLLKNMPSESQEMKASMVVTTPKPRLVRLAISAQGEDTFVVGGDKRKATHYIVKIEIGGVTGLVAPLLGKQPPDIHVWILRGEAPAFVKSRGPLYSGGPIWQIELESPVWPHRTEGGTSRPSDRKEPMRFSVRLRIHSKLVVTREKLGS
ncbi:MAG TPA: hypothetical protein VII23_22460 [Terriglobales bacterium]|jgi:hypothetical protein